MLKRQGPREWKRKQIQLRRRQLRNDGTSLILFNDVLLRLLISLICLMSVIHHRDKFDNPHHLSRISPRAGKIRHSPLTPAIGLHTSTKSRILLTHSHILRSSKSRTPSRIHPLEKKETLQRSASQCGRSSFNISSLTSRSPKVPNTGDLKFPRGALDSNIN